MKLIDIIVPCYNEEESVNLFYDEITKTFNNMNKEIDYEIIFINDGSKDKTLENMKKLSNIDSKVKYISFSRNFGKESALYAGLTNSRGDYVVIMDVDLQDPPNILPEMIDTIENSNYDIVATRRTTRAGEPPIRSFFARMFYKLINKISELELVDGARDYRIMTRQSVDALLELQEYNRFSKGLFNWIGFKTKWISYENIERATGETSWSFWGLFRYSIEGIVAFTTAPLTISTLLGIIISMAAFLIIIILLIRHFLFSDPVQGWTSTICVILLLGGIQLLSIGILGKYLEKTYTEIKNRPIYIEQESNIKK
ncbi:MAG: glycosyltransferase [Methanosphaera sp. SHI613]|jgi:glycosyltransferase involved in cell wall biosynthesis|nr:MAG: glycosyltransferase [Methanosphaera sp. SHI613]